MASKEVTVLRKSGDIENALIMAQKDLQQEPDNIWCKRAIAWVYFEFLKRNTTKNKVDEFIEYLTKFTQLNLSKGEEMVCDSIAFQIGKIVYDISKDEKSINHTKITQIFELIKEINFTKKSEAYTFIYRAFHKCSKNWNNYIEFANWWDFENFMQKDFIAQEYNNRKIMAVAEQGYVMYSKKLLDENQAINSEKIHAFLKKLDVIIENHKDYQYPIYYKAKLLLAIGDKESVLKTFIPFAKKKKNDFWVWEVLADSFDKGDDKKLACLCKGLSLKTSEDFLINTRQKVAAILLEKQMYAEAKTEVERVIKTRQDNNWKMTNQLSVWMAQDWYQNSLSHKNNLKLYNEHNELAEQILYSDVIEEIVVIDFVNESKSMLNFVKDKTKYGFFKYKGHIKNPRIGDLLKVRFHQDSSEQYYKIYSAKRISNNTPCDVITDFSGSIRINDGNNFGFVDDLFVTPQLIESNNLLNTDEVTGKAVLSFNKKKKEWGWKCITCKKK
ncbi:hypothetical protein G1K57_04550 [Tenacibaculum finnmarkense]|uniref:DUF7017 domain-containing protein n=1 Tax=Tenacibaculum finnmarkense TaxID=2781243 RepID=UPI001EFBD8B8|nr:hypothetical protein [Tenacibaculum finnmarkense]MCG8807436.1 hypothetical protein [Tenacibaculum finnmarkense]MCG8817655.1 hypothetical protein [Tenacibaculum finnmarkense]